MTLLELTRLRLPIVAAPLHAASNPKLAKALCDNGLIGSIPGGYSRTIEHLEVWISEMADYYAENPTRPYAVSLVLHRSNKRFKQEMALILKYKVPILLSSYGSPRNACKAMHPYGGLVFHEVNTVQHAEKAVQTDADALLVAPAANADPIALLNAVNAVTDKPLLLGGALRTGADLAVAQKLGAAGAHFGTRFLDAKEAAVKPHIKKELRKQDVGPSLLETVLASDLALKDELSEASAGAPAYKPLAANQDGIPAREIVDQLIAEYNHYL